MSSRSKRFWSLLLCLLMVLSLFPASAFADAELEEPVAAEEAEPYYEPEPEPYAEPEPDPEPIVIEDPEEPEIPDEPEVPEESETPEEPEPPAEPETPEAPELVEPVVVYFIVTPEGATVIVYPKATEETPEPEAIEPELDGSFLLLPGEYTYTVEAEGYETLEEEPLTVEASEAPLMIYESLTAIQAPAEPAREPEDPAEAPGEAPAEEPEEEPAEESEEEQPVRVRFICTPEDLTLTVYPVLDPALVEDLGLIVTACKPEADDSYLLLPGEYVYTAEAEGYLPLENEPLTVESGSEPLEIPVVLTAGMIQEIVITEAAYAGTQSYNPQIAAAWAKSENNVNNTSGACATFVSNALKAGGLSEVWNSNTDSLRDNIVKKGYGTQLAANDANLGKIKPGDVILACTDNHVHHVIIVTAVGSNYIRYSARNNNHCNEKMTFTQIKSYYKSWSGANNTKFISMNDTSPSSSNVANTVSYNGHVYERYDYHLSWTDAKAFCEAKGGHLVTITDSAEQNAVLGLLSGSPLGWYMMGGSDTAQTGAWSWVTGEGFSYSNWDPDVPEPDRGTGEYYSGIISYTYPPSKTIGEWFDISNGGGSATGF